jgi:signal transduction histidine kinase
MTSLRPTRKPVFLWQAGLILLPVVIMAVVAITAIIRTRADVEREAHRQAEEVARQYGKELERSWGGLLMSQEDYQRQWFDYLFFGVGAWPGSEERTQWEASTARSPTLSPQALLRQWQAQNPGLRPEEVFPDRFWLTAERGFLFGLEFNPAPQPPAWFTGLSSTQRAAWESLEAAASSRADVKEVQERLARFQETKPGQEAAKNAAFLGLRVRLATLPPADAVGEAIHPTWTRYETLTEAGLPLSNLAFSEALRYARASGPSEALWKEIPWDVLWAPSLLTPGLLAQLDELAGTNATLRAGVDAWRTLCNARLKLHDIAEAIRQSGKLRGITTTNLWIEQGDTRWLCVLVPDPTPTVDAANHTNAPRTLVRFLRKSVAECSLVQALTKAEVKLPEYLGLAAWLEGEPLALSERWSPRRGTNSAPLLLAEAGGGLSSVGRLRIAPHGPEVEWEGLASHPRFMLRIYLADQALLFASYRRQALLLTGLVAAAAFGALVGVFASWRAFQRQLRLNELKTNFVSSVSHELRAPIASVRLMAESLERGKVPEPAKQHEYFRFIVQECRRLSSLIENVLDFSRIEQGRKQYDLEPTDLVALAQQTVKLMETYAAERGVNLQLQLPNAINYQHPDYQLPADGKALQQALVNLIDNALKHSPKGGLVTVGLEPKNAGNILRSTLHAPRLLLWVEDHGEGIPLSEHERIFERFYRRGSELRRQTQGVGIGLSIVKHIIEAHGGKVLVRSSPGQGSRFTIELPVSPTPGKPEGRNPKAE